MVPNIGDQLRRFLGTVFENRCCNYLRLCIFGEYRNSPENKFWIELVEITFFVVFRDSRVLPKFSEILTAGNVLKKHLGWCVLYKTTD